MQSLSDSVVYDNDNDDAIPFAEKPEHYFNYIWSDFVVPDHMSQSCTQQNLKLIIVILDKKNLIL